MDSPFTTRRCDERSNRGVQRLTVDRAPDVEEVTGWGVCSPEICCSGDTAGDVLEKRSPRAKSFAEGYCDYSGDLGLQTSNWLASLTPESFVRRNKGEDPGQWAVDADEPLWLPADGSLILRPDDVTSIPSRIVTANGVVTAHGTWQIGDDEEIDALVAEGLAAERTVPAEQEKDHRKPGDLLSYLLARGRRSAPFSPEEKPREYVVSVARGRGPGQLGLTLDEDSPAPRVLRVREGGGIDRWNKAAKSSGDSMVEAGDFVLEVNGCAVNSVADFGAAASHGLTLKIRLCRSSSLQYSIDLHLGDAGLGLSLDPDATLPCVCQIKPGGAVDMWNMAQDNDFLKVFPQDIITAANGAVVFSLTGLQRMLQGQKRVRLQLVHQPDFRKRVNDTSFSM